MTNILTFLALKTIKFYQIYLSPYKGYSCSHRVATNGISCSAYGAKTIKRFGLFTGYKLLNRRFYDCKWHSQNNKTQQKNITYSLRTQGGFIDCAPDCGPDCEPDDLCDIPDCGNKKKVSNSFTEKCDKKNEKKYGINFKN